MSLSPFAWAAVLTGLKSRVRYHGLPDKTSFAALSGNRPGTDACRPKAGGGFGRTTCMKTKIQSDALQSFFNRRHGEL